MKSMPNWRVMKLQRLLKQSSQRGRLHVALSETVVMLVTVVGTLLTHNLAVGVVAKGAGITVVRRGSTSNDQRGRRSTNKTIDERTRTTTLREI